MAIYEIIVDGASRRNGAPGNQPALALIEHTGSEHCQQEHPISECRLQHRGDAACAVVIKKNQRLIGQYARGLGQRTNNEAEYEAVLHGLLMAWAADLLDPIIYSDSQLVVNQVNGVWTCKNSNLRPLLISVREIQEEYRFRLLHRPRRDVFEADKLCNLFLDKLLSSP